MAEDLIQQVTAAAPTATGGGIIGTILAILAGMKMFARPQDLELISQKIEVVKLELRTELAQKQAELAERQIEFAEKFVTKEMMEPVMDQLSYIRNRVDQLADRK